MLKIRLMGTKEDIEWFRGLLAEQKDFYLTNCSDCFRNQGTNRYFRAYAEVLPKKKVRKSDGESGQKKMSTDKA